MVTSNLYEQLEIDPTTPTPQIAQLIQQRLRTATGEEWTMLQAARDTLLDPASRAAYNRLHGLRVLDVREQAVSGVAAKQARAVTIETELSALRKSDRLRGTRVPFAELLFTLYFLLMALILTLWLLTLLLLGPPLVPQAAWLIELTQWPIEPVVAVMALITLGFAILALMTLYIFDRALQFTGRIVIVLLLLGATILGMAQLFSTMQLFQGIGIGALFVILIFFGIFVMRWLGMRDFDAMYSRSKGR